MEVYDCIRKRRSVRIYRDEPVSDEVVEELLESARMAPCANNRQEWAFVVVRSGEVKKRILDAVVEIETTLTQPAWKRLQVGGEPLKAMARSIGEFTGRNITMENINSQPDLRQLLEDYTRRGVIELFRADVLIAVYRTAVEGLSVSIPNAFDTGAAIENMLLAATARGFGSVWAGGFSSSETKVEYRATGMAIRAYHKDRISEILHAPKEMDLAAMVFIGRAASEPPMPPKKPLEQVAFRDQFGTPWKRSETP
jgi:nitroreductase